MADARNARRVLTAAVALLALAAAGACTSGSPSGTAPSVDAGGSGASSGGVAGDGAGPPSATDAGRGAGPDATEAPDVGGGADDASGASDAPEDAAADIAAEAEIDDATYPPPPDAASYGGVGELVLVPLQYTPAPVPPIIPADCPGDPTTGFTEYKDSFVIQRPYDLAAADRFSYEDGIYTFWVYPTDKPHAMGNGTAPRTEARYSDMKSGIHIWSADVMFESPLTDTCVEQIHNIMGAIACYYRVLDGRMFNLGTGTTVLTDYYGKWFNMKVVFDTSTLEVKTYVNNCLKDTHTAPHGTPWWYFKNGVYTCKANICRDHYKNIHLYEMGSTDVYNVKSPYP